MTILEACSQHTSMQMPATKPSDQAVPLPGHTATPVQLHPSKLLGWDPTKAISTGGAQQSGGQSKKSWRQALEQHARRERERNGTTQAAAVVPGGVPASGPLMTTPPAASVLPGSLAVAGALVTAAHPVAAQASDAPVARPHACTSGTTHLSSGTQDGIPPTASLSNRHDPRPAPARNMSLTGTKRSLRSMVQQARQLLSAADVADSAVQLSAPSTMVATALPVHGLGRTDTCRPSKQGVESAVRSDPTETSAEAEAARQETGAVNLGIRAHQPHWDNFIEPLKESTGMKVPPTHDATVSQHCTSSAARWAEAGQSQRAGHNLRPGKLEKSINGRPSAASASALSVMALEGCTGAQQLSSAQQRLASWTQQASAAPMAVDATTPNPSDAHGCDTADKRAQTQDPGHMESTWPSALDSTGKHANHEGPGASEGEAVPAAACAIYIPSCQPHAACAATASPTDGTAEPLESSMLSRCHQAPVDACPSANAPPDAPSCAGGEGANAISCTERTQAFILSPTTEPARTQSTTVHGRCTTGQATEVSVPKREKMALHLSMLALLSKPKATGVASTLEPEASEDLPCSERGLQCRSATCPDTPMPSIPGHNPSHGSNVADSIPIPTTKAISTGCTSEAPVISVPSTLPSEPAAEGHVQAAVPEKQQDANSRPPGGTPIDSASKSSDQSGCPGPASPQYQGPAQGATLADALDVAKPLRKPPVAKRKAAQLLHADSVYQSDLSDRSQHVSSTSMPSNTTAPAPNPCTEASPSRSQLCIDNDNPAGARESARHGSSARLRQPGLFRFKSSAAGLGDDSKRPKRMFTTPRRAQAPLQESATHGCVHEGAG